MDKAKVIAVIVGAVIIAIIAYMLITPSLKHGASTSVKVYIRIGGSTFQQPQQEVWIRAFTSQNPNIEITYSGVGSGAGISGFLKGIYDIGATDVPMPSSIYEEAVGRFGGVLTIPVLFGGIVITYNIPGFKGVLNLTADTIAKIYCGEIRYWDDPEIQRLNPGVKLPHREIIAVHRSDASGTTFVFTLWLYKSSEAWRKCVGVYNFTINWPVDRVGQGRGGKGNPGVAEIVKTTPYSIGYVELQYAYMTKMPIAAIQNPSTGEFVIPTPTTVLNAVSHVDLSKMPDIAEDWYKERAFALFLNVNAPNAYPIVSATYLCLRKSYDDCQKALAIYKYIVYILTKGQERVLKGYVRVPENLARHIVEQLRNSLECKGKLVSKLTG